MATNVAGRRYRMWYAMLLRLYPRPFRERFGEGMAQTFHDLCREHRDAGRGLFGLALWIFFETSVGIVRENITQMPQLGKTMLRVALGALAALMVPLVASQFVRDWNWPVGAFVIVYVLFFATGMVYAHDREEDGRVVVQGGRWCGAGDRVRLGVGDHGPGRGLGTSGAAVVPQCARGGGDWSVPGSAESSGIGLDVVRDGSDSCADCRDTAFGRAARPCAENGHRAWCLRGVVHRVRSAVPAREFGGITIL